MSQTLAAECRLVVSKFLASCGSALTFKHSLASAGVSDAPGGRAGVRVTFSRPTAAAPAPAAVVHVRFVLSEALDAVQGFQLEEDPHVWPAADVAFDDRALQRTLDRKLRVRAARLVDLDDDFASTRLPAAIRAAQHRARLAERESVEEALLDFFQRRDPYNDGRLALRGLAAAARELQLGGPTGKLPAEVVLALAPAADRDALVEYGPLVPLAAEAADAWAGWEYYREPDATADAESSSGRESGDEDEDEDDVDAVAAFEAVHERQTRLLEDRLRRLLEAAAVANAPATDGDEAAADEDEGTTRPQFVTLRQLRGALELPALLLSASESNLVLALAVEGSTSTGDGDGDRELLLEAAPLPTLVRLARRALFRFQRRTFASADAEDALETYLLRQFEAFERDSLQGSAQHLSGRLSLKQAKRVVLDELPRLALSLLQAADCVALCDGPGDRVAYRERVPEMADALRRSVDDAQLAAEAAAVASDELTEALATLIAREDEVRTASLHVFRALDSKQLGVVPVGSMAEAAAQLAQELGLLVDREDEVRVLSAAADPTGAGRVNYAAFQHRVLPLAVALTQRRFLHDELAGAKH